MRTVYCGFVVALLFAALIAPGCGTAGLNDRDNTTSGSVQILEQTSFASGDEIIMQGVVLNDSDELIDFAVVRGNAYDDRGEVIGSGTDDLKQIEAGEEAPFEILINPDVDGLESIEWHCTAEME